MEHYPTRDAVLAAEKRAIIAERPLYNEVHNRESGPQANAAPSSGLRVICFGCREEIRGERGVLHVHNPDVYEVGQERRRIKEERSARDPSGWEAWTVSDLRAWPKPARWQVHCDDCNPHYDEESDAWCNTCYWISAGRLRSWSRLVELTAHLSEKEWLRNTNWFEFIRCTALGTSDVGLVAPTSETGAC